MKKLILLLFAISATFIGRSQSLESINLERELASKANIFTNGYESTISGESINYSNMWNERDAAFITRATNGKMNIVWQTEPVKKITNGYAEFIMIACIDQANPSKRFDFFIGSQLIGSVSNFGESYFKKKESSGVEYEFISINKNGWGDASFFFIVRVPESMAKVGEKLQFKMLGENASSNAWFILFENKKLIEEIIHRAANNDYSELNLIDSKAEISLPKHHIGKNYILTTTDESGKSIAVKSKFSTKNSNSYAELLDVSSNIKGLKLESEDNVIFDFKDLKNVTDQTSLNGYRLTKITNKSVGETNQKIVVQRIYSASKDVMKQISSSPYSDAKVYVMISSHQDIAWVDSPFQCIEDRDKIIVTPALELLEKHEDYRYDIEDGLILEEYLERHPDKRPLIEKLILKGQLGIGATYTQPYEEMQSGEALIRQLYFGKRWVDREFKGSNAQTYWNVDVPGRTLQMAQILAKADVKAIQYSRHERGIYEWFSPDNSSVMVYTPGHYTVASQFLRKTPEEGLEKFSDYINSFKEYRTDMSKPAVIGMLSAEDMSPAHTYYNWIDKFKEFSDTLSAPMPTLVHSTSDMFVTEFLKNSPNMPKVVGERPDLWLYIHGPTHERAITTYREATRGATSAETFSTIASLLKGSFTDYPTFEINGMWKDIIYADHGWGGNKGYITDSLFYARYRNADRVATKINKEATTYISSNINTDSKNGTPIVVFNPTSIVYSSPIKVTIDTKINPIDKLSLINSKGEEVPCQVTEDKAGKATLEFIAKNMPAVGYETYYLTARTPKSVTISPIESTFYKLLIKDGKLTQIFDKELKKELFDTEKFEVGEIFTMQSVGNGAGEFATMQLPTMEGFDKTSSHNAKWELVTSGSVYSLYQSKTKFEDATIVRYLKLYNDIKRIDFTSEILGFNGRHYREFRQAFPLKSRGEVSYEVPFGSVTVGKDEMKGIAGERYKDEVSTIHPRGILNWFGAKTNDVNVMLTSSVAVVDYIDPTDNPTDKTILQPILLASRRSCHWLGTFYEQHGDHKFEFSLRSDAVNSETSAIESRAANYTPYVVYNPEKYTSASLAPKLSFFNIDKEGVVISTIKKSEDDNDIIIRMYDAIGKKENVSINSMFQIGNVSKTDIIEFNETPLSSNVVEVGNKSIETYKLKVNYK